MFCRGKGKSIKFNSKVRSRGGGTPICPKQGPKMKGIVLHRVGILGFFFSLPRERSNSPSPGTGFQTLSGTYS